ncbi:MAG: preprotein translocase subunit YajC [Bacteroidetes bacterium]|nr:preprotein translocase subunit YajC [Bacteroidota bacterium]HET6244369.1 preprotein translocase subunit YajC [Bacteroidia bacterium]
MTNLVSILLMNQEEGGGFMSLLPLVLIVIVFYFFMIRPQLKKAKDQKKFREAIKKGDKVITIGGIHAKIVDVHETTFTIEVEGGTKMKIEKSAVSMDAASIMGQK